MSEPRAFLDGKVVLHRGDCLDVLTVLPDASIDSCVTDPPYHLTSIVRRFGAADAAPAKDYSSQGDDPPRTSLDDGSPVRTGAYARASRGFMGKQWDGGDIAFRPEIWRQVLRVLKPGGHVVAFGASRGYHRMACAIEDAGFEIRDSLLDLVAADDAVIRFVDSLSPDQADAFWRVLSDSGFGGLLAWIYGSGFPKSHDVSKAIDKTAGHWRGRAGAVLDRTVNQVAKGVEYERAEKGDPVTAAAAWDGWGTALKPAFEPIVLARKPLAAATIAANVLDYGTGALNIDACRVAANEGDAPLKWETPRGGIWKTQAQAQAQAQEKGRWPANVIRDDSTEVEGMFPDTDGVVGALHDPNGSLGHHGGALGGYRKGVPDSGSVARFFYSAKADGEDRIGSKHPTVKPVDLIAWLIRLVTPRGGIVLDPFAGSGTAGEAACREGCRALLIEREDEYCADIARRMALVLAGPEEKARAIIKAKGDLAPVDGLPLFVDEHGKPRR